MHSKVAGASQRPNVIISESVPGAMQAVFALSSSAMGTYQQLERKLRENFSHSKQSRVPSIHCKQYIPLQVISFQHRKKPWSFQPAAPLSTHLVQKYCITKANLYLTRTFTKTVISFIFRPGELALKRWSQGCVATSIKRDTVSFPVCFSVQDSPAMSWCLCTVAVQVVARVFLGADWV